MNIFRKDRYNDSDSEVNEAFLKDGPDSPASRGTDRGRTGNFCILQLFIISIYTVIFFVLSNRSNPADVYCKSLTL